MKIIVDTLPEHPEDCLFSELATPWNVRPCKYNCKIDNDLCRYYKPSWSNECPYLKEQKKEVISHASE